MTVTYTFANGAAVDDPFVAQVTEGSDFSRVLTPVAQSGYVATYDGKEINQLTIDLTNVTDDHTYNVIYVAGQSPYTVRRWYQNIEDDEYTLSETVNCLGLTDSPVSHADVDVDVTGFDRIEIESSKWPVIAADGSTIVDVYYDRQYHSVTFDLDGGTGVNNVMAKYGDTLTAGEPTRTGFSFMGWVDEAGEATVCPATIPAEDLTLIAEWGPAVVNYTVVYWTQNANDDNYTIIGEAKHGQAEVGTLISQLSVETTSVLNDTSYFPMTNFAKYSPNFSTGKFFSYAGMDSTVDTVQADGSTVINVYFDRNVYTVYLTYSRKDSAGNFYTCTSTPDVTRTGFFASSDVWKVNSDFSLEAYQAAQGGDASTYKSATEGNYTYYYHAITARYGEDISDRWPNMKNKDSQYSIISWGTSKNKTGKSIIAVEQSGNRCVKGLYSKMDEYIILEADDPSAIHYMTAYGNSTAVTWHYKLYLDLSDADAADLLNTTHEVWQELDYRGNTPAYNMTELVFRAIRLIVLPMPILLRKQNSERLPAVPTNRPSNTAI